MEPRITLLPAKKLVGKSIRTTLRQNQTVALWQSFMPLRKHIHTISPSLYAVHVYDSVLTDAFMPETPFDKWAAVEVAPDTPVPEQLQALLLPEGLYAVFIHKGLSSDFPRTMAQIYSEWLPQSEYALDHRPHFEVMLPGYSPTDPDAEEEVWVPVRKR